MTFFQGTTAHCEADALAHVSRDNPDAESVTLHKAFDMGFGNLTMYRFEVTMPARPIEMYFRFCEACKCYEYDCFGTSYRSDCIHGEADYKPAHQRARERKQCTNNS